MDFKHNENQIALYSEDGDLLAEVTFPYADETTVQTKRQWM